MVAGQVGTHSRGAIDGHGRFSEPPSLQGKIKEPFLLLGWTNHSSSRKIFTTPSLPVLSQPFCASCPSAVCPPQGSIHQPPHPLTVGPARLSGLQKGRSTHTHTPIPPTTEAREEIRKGKKGREKFIHTPSTVDPLCTLSSRYLWLCPPLLCRVTCRPPRGVCVALPARCLHAAARREDRQPEIQ